MPQWARAAIAGVAGLSSHLCLNADELTLGWSDNSDNENGFAIERSLDGENYFQIASVGPDLLSFSDVLVAPNQSYSYRLRAFNEIGFSTYSNVAFGSFDAGIPVINEIVNPGFESGLSSWTFFANGQANAAVFQPGYEGSNAAKISVNRRLSNIQLFQSDVTLEPNTSYQLSFAARSNSGRDLRVSLSKHTAPYTNYGMNRARVDLTDSWQTFTIDFVTTGFSLPVNDGRFYFWFASDGRAGDEYFIDDVVLTSGDVDAPSTPTGLNTEPASETSVRLSWADSIDNLGVAFYRVYRNGIPMVDVLDPLYVDGDVDVGLGYNYTVEAFDAAGNRSGVSSEIFTVVRAEENLDLDLHLGLGFEEASGSLTFDVSNNANDGILDSGVHRVENGRFGRALRFPGGGKLVDLGSMTLPEGNEVTMAAWINPETSSVFDAWIAAQAVGEEEEGRLWMLGVNGARARASLKTANGTLAVLTGSTHIPTDLWTHIAASYDGSVFELYVNGVLDVSLPLSGDVARDASAPSSIGDQHIGGHGFVGLIDDVRIYSRALALPELIAMLNEPVTAVGVDDVEAPSAPNSLTAIAVSPTKTTLFWWPSSDNDSVLGYLIYRDGIDIGSSFKTSFVDRGLDPDRIYRYTVTAFDQSGNESIASNEAIPVDILEPVRPRDLHATQNANGSVRLTWSESQDNLGVVYYRVYRNGVLLDTVSAPEFEDDDVDVGSGYHYYVEAFDLAGNISLASRELLSVVRKAPGDDPDLWMGMGFEELPGSWAFDVTPNGNDGILDAGLSRTETGRFGRALEFAGDGELLRLGNPMLPNAGRITIAAWIKPERVGAEPSYVVAKAAGEQYSDVQWMLGLGGDGGVRVTASLAMESGGVETLEGATDVPLGEWTHISATYDGLRLNLYVNGQIDASMPVAGAIAEDPFVPMAIGGHPGGGNNFDGLIDDFRIYSRPMVMAQLLTMMNQEVASSRSEDEEPPLAPNSLVATAESEDSAYLSWETSIDNIGVFGYVVYRDGVAIGSALEAEYRDSGLDASRIYEYVVTAFDHAGNESLFSSPVEFEITVDEENALSNGGFENGLSSWIFYTNGSGGANASGPGHLDSGAAVINIETAATNLQLYQHDLYLEPYTDYRLSFVAYSNSGRDMRVTLAKHTAPYTRYGVNKRRANLSQSWRSFTIDFTTSGFSEPVNDARFYFWFAKHARAGDVYYIDDVVLSKR